MINPPLVDAVVLQSTGLGSVYVSGCLGICSAEANSAEVSTASGPASFPSECAHLLQREISTGYHSIRPLADKILGASYGPQLG